MPKVSDEHKTAVRERILEATRVVLERNGYQDVTTRQILAEAGLSTGTLYNYFPTKSALYEALAESMLGEDLARLAARAGEQPGNAAGIVEQFVREELAGGRQAAAGVSLFRSAASGDDTLDAIRTLNGWIVEAFSPLVEAAQADGTLRDDVPSRALVELLDIIWDGLARRIAQGTLQTDNAAIGEVLVAIMRDGAFRSPAATGSTEPS